MPPLRILGIDPGLTRCGLGVVEGPAGRPTFVSGEVFSTAADDPVDQRLHRLHRAVTGAIGAHRPQQVAVERVLFSRNVRTAMATGQAAGVCLLAAAEAGLPVVSYTPTEVKLAVAGHGGADKDAVARMVGAQLRLPEAPRPADLADALAIALCHLGRAQLAGRASASAATAGAQRGWSGRGGWEAKIAASPHVREAGGA